MLKDDFFSILNHTLTDNYKADFTIELNPEHAIYHSHFPNNPITPGVCIIQIAKESFSFLKQTDFIIKKIKTAKFIHPIIPTIHPIINYQMEWNKIKQDEPYYIKTIVCREDIVFSKINLFIEEQPSSK
jgi:3-hydroxyacyl-[acyl-carrier-protein] dehydratase